MLLHEKEASLKRILYFVIPASDILGKTKLGDNEKISICQGTGCKGRLGGTQDVLRP